LTLSGRLIIGQNSTQEDLPTFKFGLRRDALREAALAAGISAHRASKLSIYDFRRGRGTEGGRAGNLIGIAYLMGHKHVTTTKEYLHSNLEEAEAVLFRTSGEESRTRSAQRR
jgi:integrase